jgi:hypothetical protein
MNFLNGLKNRDFLKHLDFYGRKGVAALSAATPVDTGKTAASWNYEIHYFREGVSMVWTNSNVNKGENIAILIQYGHGTRNGGFVQGRDYINPALRPIFDEIADSAWKEVTSL